MDNQESTVKNDVIEKQEIQKNQTQSAEPQVLEQDPSTILGFISSPNGSQLVSQVVSTIEGLQQHGNKAQIAITKFDKLITCILVLVVIAAVTWLTYADKFTPSIGVLFGTLVGYIYGKKN